MIGRLLNRARIDSITLIADPPNPSSSLQLEHQQLYQKLLYTQPLFSGVVYSVLLKFVEHLKNVKS